MEDLAAVVIGILLAQLTLGLASLIFSAIYFFKSKFRITSLILTAILLAETAWAFTISQPLGGFSAVPLALSAFFRFVPSSRSR
ncbi:MAG: hypothetical protein RLZZ258_169 [Actinomycetota bacterium]|jgi:hypothetical protein